MIAALQVVMKVLRSPIQRLLGEGRALILIELRFHVLQMVHRRLHQLVVFQDIEAP